MSEDIQGFMYSPAEQIRNAFEKVAADTMHDLTFLHPSMPVYVTELTLFEGQWTGCVITPWMFSAVIFRGRSSSGRSAKSVKKSACGCRTAS